MAVETFEGWYSAHLVYALDVTAWQKVAKTEQEALLAELSQFINMLEANHEAKEGSYAFYAVNGQKGDLLLWLLRPTLDELKACELAFRSLRIHAYLTPTYSFVSVIELSNHLGQDMNHPMVRARLHPQVPKRPYICFYPMNKRRNLSDNWFMLTDEERSKMMFSHGKIGRKYEGLIQQYITAACGLDDREWGVTLLADDAVQFKKIVYEMRFDEVSARFGEFGPFLVGTLLTADTLHKLFV